MKKIIGAENKMFYLLIGLVVFFGGVFLVNALAPGVSPVQGHLINEMSPPSGCVAGQFLQWEGSSWVCANPDGSSATTPTATVPAPTTTPTTIIPAPTTTPTTSAIVWLGGVYSHTSDACVALGGEVVYDGTIPFCRFDRSSCIAGWTPFKNWSKVGGPQYIPGSQEWDRTLIPSAYGSPNLANNAREVCDDPCDPYIGGNRLQYINPGVRSWADNNVANTCNYYNCTSPYPMWCNMIYVKYCQTYVNPFIQVGCY